MATYKGKLKQKTGANTYDVLHPETSADNVVYSGTVSGATNIKEAVEAVSAVANAAVPASSTALTAGTHTKITYNVYGLVTGGQDLSDSDIPDLGASKITSGTFDAARIPTLQYSKIQNLDESITNKTVVTSIDASPSASDAQIPTEKAVRDAIDALPSPVVFKGSLGTGGTITSLPSASSSNDGFMYKVITDGTYASQAAKIGDMFISNGSEWVLFPSGDEPSGTVTSIGLQMPTGFSVSTPNPIVSSGTFTVSFASGYSLPTTAKQEEWDAKINKSVITAKGDLIYGSAASSPTRLAIGTAGQYLKVGSDGVPVWTSVDYISPSGVTAGTYSAVTVDSNGLVTQGGQVFKVINNGATPDVVTGGLYFEKDA